MKLPIFPLPIFLLPGGITRLRIFEQRYLNMVRNAEKTKGFAIRYYSSSKSFLAPNWASWVEIIDFDMKSDGVLMIDVKCHSLVTILETERNHENLLLATISEKNHWLSDINLDGLKADIISDMTMATKITLLTEQLSWFFNRNPEFDKLYQDKNYQDPYWVCCRWLELLPVNFADKALFVEPSSFPAAIQFIDNILSLKSDLT